MKNIRKFMATLFAVLVLLGITLGSTTTAYAANNHVTNIDIEVVIREDGSAVITQYWTGEFNKGTENYLPIRLDGLGLSDFSVSDENGPYTFVEDWDVDWSFKKKAGKCGIVSTDEGVELCFGITEYGHKEYTFSYVITDFIKGYRDANGTNFMFINPEMSTFPTAGRIEIVMEDGTKLDDSNTDIWAFGFEGRIEFQDGRVVAYTEKDLEDDHSMIVMLELEKELLSPKAVLPRLLLALMSVGRSIMISFSSCPPSPLELGQVCSRFQVPSQSGPIRVPESKQVILFLEFSWQSV